MAGVDKLSASSLVLKLLMQSKEGEHGCTAAMCASVCHENDLGSAASKLMRVQGGGIVKRRLELLTELLLLTNCV